MSELERTNPPDGVLVPAQPGAAAQSYASASSAANTRRAYRADWADFVAWCEQVGQNALPASSLAVADYLAARAEGGEGQPPLAVATLERRLVAISRAHELKGLPSPVDSWVRTVMKGIRRKHHSAQRRVAPLVIEVLRQTVLALPETLQGQRDRALLLLGFAGALRRSELVALLVADLRFVPQGVILTLRQSKTDQDGAGLLKGIPFGQHAQTCPVRAVQNWLKAAKLADGPLFRPIDRHGNLRPKRLNGSDVAVIIKRSVAAAGFDPAEYSGHSLRAGLATAAASVGAASYRIRRQTGHASDRMLEVYIREGSLFNDNVAGLLGL
jgi:integrase